MQQASQDSGGLASWQAGKRDSSIQAKCAVTTSPPWNQFTRVYHPPRELTHTSRWPPLSAMGRPLPPANWVSLLPAGFYSHSVMLMVKELKHLQVLILSRPPQGFAASNDAWHIPVLPDIGKVMLSSWKRRQRMFFFSCPAIPPSLTDFFTAATQSKAS